MSRIMEGVDGLAMVGVGSGLRHRPVHVCLTVVRRAPHAI